MAKRRRKAKDKSAKEDKEKSKRFMWMLVAIFVLFVVGYIVLQIVTG
jgi:uncharacterized membrane protein (DUF485 family)